MNGDRILVRPDPDPVEKVSRGGIIIPKTVEPSNMRTGRVVKIGPGMPMFNGDRWPMPDCNIGDHVVYFRPGTTRVKIDGEEYISMHQESVCAVIEEEGEVE